MSAVRSSPLQRNTLHRDDIVRAGLEIAAKDGLEGLSMRRLAAAIPCTPMAVYRHVRDKDELLELVADAALSEIAAPPEGGAWQERLRRFSREARRVLDQYPGVASLFLSHPLSPSARRVGREGLALLHDAGFDEHEALLAWGLLRTFVLGHLHLEHASADGSEAPLFPHASADEHFDYGIDRLIEGYEAQLNPTKRRRR